MLNSFYCYFYSLNFLINYSYVDRTDLFFYHLLNNMHVTHDVNAKEVILWIDFLEKKMNTW